MTTEQEQISSLKSQIKNLQESSKSKDEFIRVTNHELRTPLDVIRGNLDMILKGETGEIPKKTKEYLGDALLGADRLTKLVNDMLDISRIETSRIEFRLENIDVIALLKKIKKEFAIIAKEKNITINIEHPSKIPDILSDRARIFQIIDNLIGNSLKFTPKNGSITISASAKKDSILISIKDTGIGINKEDQNKLFKRFPQIDTGIVGNIKGTGLGLNIASNLVKKLGGKIWAESPGIGKGSTFSFELPRVDSKYAK
ncbi:sensor histidine kinase [Patescibacteria group bacterium]